MIVREFVFGMPSGISQGPTVREQTWNAISVTEDDGNGPTPPPPPPTKFPWYLFAIGGVVIVGIRTKKVLDKDRRA